MSNQSSSRLLRMGAKYDHRDLLHSRLQLQIEFEGLCRPPARQTASHDARPAPLAGPRPAWVQSVAARVLPKFQRVWLPIS